MIVQITDKFFDNISIVQAAKDCKDSVSLMRVWSTIAKLSFQQGEPMANIIKIKRKVELTDENSMKGFDSLVSTGMIQSSDSKANLPTELFEQWWKEYPARIVNGKKVKVGKAKAKKLFENLITTADEFDMLTIATRNYSNLCNKLPKDAERFLRANFWREYYEVPSVGTPYVQGDIGEVDGNYLQDMLRR